MPTTTTDKPLSERRAADRKKMASLLAAEMVKAGAKAEIKPSERYPRLIRVEIDAPGGVCITVDFDGTSTQPDVFVVTWNTFHADRTKRVFLNPAIGEVNPYHYGKATRVCYGFDALVRNLQRDVKWFVDGSAYMTESDPRVEAMRQSYVERGWNW